MEVDIHGRLEEYFPPVFPPYIYCIYVLYSIFLCGRMAPSLLHTLAHLNHPNVGKYAIDSFWTGCNMSYCIHSGTTIWVLIPTHQATKRKDLPGSNSKPYLVQTLDPQGVVNARPLTSKGLLTDTLSVVPAKVYPLPDPLQLFMLGLLRPSQSRFWLLGGSARSAPEDGAWYAGREVDAKHCKIRWCIFQDVSQHLPPNHG